MRMRLAAGSPSFNRNMARLAIPIVLQNLVTTAVSSADVIMLGFVSQDALAAGSLASQIMFILSLVYAGISSGVLMLAAQYWGKQDTLSIERIMGIGMRMYYILGQAVNTALICGVFRSGGDSRWGFICDTIDMWVYAVPLGFLAAFVLKLPPMWVYFLICTDEFVKIPFVYKHYKSYKWLKNITRDF